MEINRVSDYIRLIGAEAAGYVGNQSFLYRGESRTDYMLIPSLYREKTVNGVTSMVYLEDNDERNIIHEFITEAASFSNSINIEDSFRWVQYAQHFGVPTRLLDWTINPLVALYFACISNQDVDGKVYVLQSESYKQRISDQLSNELNGRSVEQVANNMIWHEEKGFEFPTIIRPFYFDKRMSAQSSCFMMWGDKKEPFDIMLKEMEKEKPSLVFRTIVKGDERIIVQEIKSALSEFIVPANMKNRLLHELDAINVNQATLFPGLDGIGKSIEWRNNYFNRDDPSFILML